MEKVKEILASSEIGKTTLTPKTSESTSKTSELKDETVVDLEALAKEELEQHLLGMNLYSLDHSFKNFHWRRGNPEQQESSRACLNAFKELANGETDKPFLMCYGGVGNGKTALCEALVIRLRERNFLARYHTVASILTTFKRYMNYQDSTMDRVIRSYTEARFLIMDDLGAEYGSPWEASIIENLIDERYRYRRITVATTNLDISELSPRLSSRFSDPEVSVCILNKGSDYRRIKRK